jgi:hypothetical protein
MLTDQCSLKATHVTGNNFLAVFNAHRAPYNPGNAKDGNHRISNTAGSAGWQKLCEQEHKTLQPEEP